SGSSGSIRLLGRVTALSALTPGTVYYASATAGALTSSAPANARAIGVADTSTSIILSQWIPLPDASTTVAGKVSTGTQSFAGAKTGTGQWSFGVPPTFNPGTSASASATVSGRITTNTTAVGNVGGGEDDLMTYSLAANSLATNGQAIHVTAFGTFGANANNKTIKFFFGATSVTLLSAA